MAARELIEAGFGGGEGKRRRGVEGKRQAVVNKTRESQTKMECIDKVKRLKSAKRKKIKRTATYPIKPAVGSPTENPKDQLGGLELRKDFNFNSIQQLSQHAKQDEKIEINSNVEKLFREEREKIETREMGSGRAYGWKWWVMVVVVRRTRKPKPYMYR